jgi:hypothetical protein
MVAQKCLLLKCISSVYNLLATVLEPAFEKGSPAASVIISRASITFSSSYLLPTSCSEIGASTYLSGVSARAIKVSNRLLHTLSRTQLTKLMIIPILLIPRHILPIHHILRPTLQSRMKHSRGIIQQVPLAGISPVARTVQRWCTPRSHRAKHHIHHPNISIAT